MNEGYETLIVLGKVNHYFVGIYERNHEHVFPKVSLVYKVL